MKKHWAIYCTNASDKDYVMDKIFNTVPCHLFADLKDLKGAICSKVTLEKYIDQEYKYGSTVLSYSTAQPLKTMSSGERKKVLLKHILDSAADFIVLDSPFDNLDHKARIDLQKQLLKISEHTIIIQLFSRKTNKLPFTSVNAVLEGKKIKIQDNLLDTIAASSITRKKIPKPIVPSTVAMDILVDLSHVTVKYGKKVVLNRIDWQIGKGDFWKLQGKNGSGKTTILSMITGENPKAYGQEIYLFGIKKGSGESIWEIKKNIGYFTPSLTDRFRGRHTIEHMLISGLVDAIGLYQRPTEIQLNKAHEWLRVIGLHHHSTALFCNLSAGQQRLVMCARAMIKHPPLLILDEPTEGLDDDSAALVVALVNQFAEESKTAIIFVSHHEEPGLRPKQRYTLHMTPKGSIGAIV